MHIGLIIFVTLLIILFVIVKNKSQNKKENDLKNKDAMETSEENTEMIDAFYEEIRNGGKAYKLTSIFNQFDLIFIQSLFQSEQIPYHIE
jgi:sortase (surface protein transpeptidase)